jgi:methionyl-tRNA formyltransferase
MKLAIIGQQDFGKAVLEAFIARGDEVVGVFCAQEKEGAKPDPLKVAALEKNVKLFQLPSLKGAEAQQSMRSLAADIGVMAYVLQFAPQDFVNIPKHGTIQYHPSLLPKHRGPSSINWPIIHGETMTGLTIFRPTDGSTRARDSAKEAAIGPDDSGGVASPAVPPVSRRSGASYCGRHRKNSDESRQVARAGAGRRRRRSINKHADQIYDLIRGCSPRPELGRR